MIYTKGGRYFLEASDRTRREEAGFWIATGEVTILAATVSDPELGNAVLATLARSRVEVAVPSRETKLEAGLFRAMGVRSRRAAMETTRACGIARDVPEGALRLEPQENGGASGEARGYRPIAEAAIVLPPSSTAVEVGRAVRAALDRSRLVT